MTPRAQPTLVLAVLLTVGVEILLTTAEPDARLVAEPLLPPLLQALLHEQTADAAKILEELRVTLRVNMEDAAQAEGKAYSFICSILSLWYLLRYDKNSTGHYDELDERQTDAQVQKHSAFGIGCFDRVSKQLTLHQKFNKASCDSRASV